MYKLTASCLVTYRYTGAIINFLTIPAYKHGWGCSHFCVSINLVVDIVGPCTGNALGEVVKVHGFLG